jgi:hypothetical protein
VFNQSSAIPAKKKSKFCYDAYSERKSCLIGPSPMGLTG